MTMGWWHTRFNKDLQPPQSALPSYLQTLRLAPPIQMEIEQELLPNWRIDKWSVGRCLDYHEDPYDTVDWKNRQAGMPQKRRREQDIMEAMGSLPLKTECEHVEKRLKRMEPTPPVSTAGLRGGCLDPEANANFEREIGRAHV